MLGPESTPYNGLNGPGVWCERVGISVVEVTAKVGKSVILSIQWPKMATEGFVMAAKKSRTFSTLLMQRSKLGALSKSQNWSAGSWPNQSFCERNKLYPRDFAGKAFPSCIQFRILLIWLDSFDLKWNSQYDVSWWEWFWQMESDLSMKGVLFFMKKYTKEVLPVLSNMVYKRIRGWISGRSISA